MKWVGLLFKEGIQLTVILTVLIYIYILTNILLSHLNFSSIITVYELHRENVGHLHIGTAKQLLTYCLSYRTGKA